MRIDVLTRCVTAGLAVSICFAGCSPKSPADKAPPAEAGHFEGDGHDHGADAAQEHPTQGPHGGRLIELGNEEYHAELLPDESANTVTVYLLDASGAQAVAIAQPEITVQLVQDGQFLKYVLKGEQASGDPASAASVFRIVDADLCDALHREEGATGRLQVTIDGKPYSGSIEYRGGDGHEHDGDGQAAER